MESQKKLTLWKLWVNQVPNNDNGLFLHQIFDSDWPKNYDVIK